MSRRRNKFNSSTYRNNRTYINIYNRLKQLSINAYEWVNLPPTIDERFLELTLYSTGYCLFFKDEDLDKFLVSECGIGSPQSFYHIPTEYHAYSINGYSKFYDIDNSVLIYNNYLREPTEFYIRDFAKRLYEIQRTMDVNVRSMKLPIYISGTEDEKLALTNLFMQYDGNQAPICVYKGKLNSHINNIGVIDLKAPYNIDKLTLYYHEIWNQALTFIGIKTVDIQKKERLTERESESSQGITDMQRDIMLDARRQACDKINRIYGLSGDKAVSVRFRYGTDELKDLVNQLEEKIEDESAKDIERGVDE